MRLDQVGQDLIAGARYAEQPNGYAKALMHPLTCVARTLQREMKGGGFVFRTVDHHRRYYAAAKRLHECCGLDNMDLTQNEAIDSLVAAAFWEIP